MFIKKSLLILLTAINIIVFSASAHAHKMQVFKNAQGQKLDSLNIDGINAFLSDTVSSHDNDAPITCGFFRMEKGKSLEYTYTYDEAKIIVEGDMTVTEAGGETVKVVAGDVLYFDKGAKMTFSSESYGIGFYCGQRALGEI